MEIKTNDKFCIVTPFSPKLDMRESSRLINEIKRYSSLSIGLDLSFAQDCTIDFLEEIKNLNISLFNIPSDIFAILNFMNYDKKLELYVSEEDFINSTRRLLNRKFAII